MHETRTQKPTLAIEMIDPSPPRTYIFAPARDTHTQMKNNRSPASYILCRQDTNERALLSLLPNLNLSVLRVVVVKTKKTEKRRRHRYADWLVLVSAAALYRRKEEKKDRFF